MGHYENNVEATEDLFQQKQKNCCFRKLCQCSLYLYSCV